VSAFVVLYAFTADKSRTTRSSQERPELKVINGYIGKDLNKAEPDELSPLLTALRSIDPVRDNSVRAFRKHLGHESLALDDFETFVGPYPRYVWVYGHDGRQPGFLVFERDTMTPHPGSTFIRLTAYDHAGIAIGRNEFTTGWRCYLDGARVERVAGFEYPLVVITTTGFIGPADEQQYYACVGGRFDLVRLRGWEGKTDRNGYWLNHGRRGPVPPCQSAAKWELDLMSGDRARVLRALTWLGGYHLLPLKPGIERRGEMEPEADADLAREVRERPLVKARLKEIADGPDGWEREAAKLALTAEDARWF
jgi:hypothetical protein